MDLRRFWVQNGQPRGKLGGAVMITRENLEDAVNRFADANFELGEWREAYASPEDGYTFDALTAEHRRTKKTLWQMLDRLLLSQDQQTRGGKKQWTTP